MSMLRQSNYAWQKLPLVGLLVSEWDHWQYEWKQPHYHLASVVHGTPDLLPYAIDMAPLLSLPFGELDEVGVPYNHARQGYPAGYHPTSIAQYALARWNAYLATGDEKHKEAFLVQARWLVENEKPLGNHVGGWPVPFALYAYNAPPMWLSALTQGNAISVLVRAYQLSSNDQFLQVARRAVRTFELDSCDGGVATTVGEDGVFFEEVANTPAAHVLNGYLLALFGLYDYVHYVDDSHINVLIKRSLTTLHTLIDEFDTGYWSLYDLRFRIPAPLFYHALHVTLLQALAHLSGCQHCAMLAVKWDRYQNIPGSRLRYFIMSRLLRGRRVLLRNLSHLLPH
jgi:heparosan-N-sulfate-glucuronate 5-epimerase